MINLNSPENDYPDLGRNEKIARFLAQELPSLSLNSEPLDVIESLENLSDEMSQMPEVIQDCRLATEAFSELNRVIGHMYALADRAVELPEDSREERGLLDEDFKGYSHIVARLSGADSYDGPSFSLASRPAALAARTILGYLNEARSGFTLKLAAQRRQINMAMTEALNLLAKIVYETEELSHQNRRRLEEILENLAGLIELSQGEFKREPPMTHFH